MERIEALRGDLQRLATGLQFAGDPEAAQIGVKSIRSETREGVAKADNRVQQAEQRAGTATAEREEADAVGDDALRQTEEEEGRERTA